MNKIQRTSIEDATIKLIKANIETLRREKNKNRERAEVQVSTKDIVKFYNWRPAIETLDIIATQGDLDVNADARRLIRAAVKITGLKLNVVNLHLDILDIKDPEVAYEAKQELKEYNERIDDCADEIVDILNQ